MAFFLFSSLRFEIYYFVVTSDRQAFDEGQSQYSRAEELSGGGQMISFQCPKNFTTVDLGDFLRLVQIQDHLVAESKAFLRRPLVVTRRQATHQ